MKRISIAFTAALALAAISGCKKKGGGDINSVCEDNFAHGEKDGGKWSPGKGDKKTFMDFCLQQKAEVVKCTDMDGLFDKDHDKDCKEHTGVGTPGFQISMKISELRNKPGGGGDKPADKPTEAAKPVEKPAEKPAAPAAIDSKAIAGDWTLLENGKPKKTSDGSRDIHWVFNADGTGVTKAFQDFQTTWTLDGNKLVIKTKDMADKTYTVLEASEHKLVVNDEKYSMKSELSK